MLAWYGSSSAADKKALQRVIKTAQNITKQHLPALEDIFVSHCLQKIHNILKDPYHPAYNLFELLPSGKRYRSVKTHTTRFILSYNHTEHWTENTFLTCKKSQSCAIILSLEHLFHAAQWKIMSNISWIRWHIYNFVVCKYIDNKQSESDLFKFASPPSRIHQVCMANLF